MSFGLQLSWCALALGGLAGAWYSFLPDFDTTAGIGGKVFAVGHYIHAIGLLVSLLAQVCLIRGYFALGVRPLRCTLAVGVLLCSAIITILNGCFVACVLTGVPEEFPSRILLPIANRFGSVSLFLLAELFALAPFAVALTLLLLRLPPISDTPWGTRLALWVTAIGVGVQVMSGLVRDLALSGAVTSISRDWYSVANLGASAGEFVAVAGALVLAVQLRWVAARLRVGNLTACAEGGLPQGEGADGAERGP